MAVAAPSSTTLSVAIDNNQSVIGLTSITGVVKGQILVVRSEYMKVLATPTAATAVSVVRGVGGSRSVAQPILAIVYFATPDTWLALLNNAIGLTGDSGTLPPYCTPGTTAVDGAGNVYVMVDLTTPCYSGTTVIIVPDGTFTASPAVGGIQGSVGVTVEEGTSAQFVWAQIYGYNAYVQDSTGTSAATSAYNVCAATSVSTPNVGAAFIARSSVDQYVIAGMFAVAIATTTVTSATSATGVAVPCWLNYPYSLGVQTPQSSL